MILKVTDRNELVKYNIEKAVQCSEDVEFLIKNKKLSLAVNRIYYGIFYITTALAIKNGFSTSKHLQLISWFDKNFIKNNLLDKKFSKIYHRAYEDRSEADYGTYIEFTEPEANKKYSEMKEFIIAIKALI